MGGYVYIHKIEIYSDCDNGILFDTGAGEFSYKIEIKDNSKVVKVIENNNISEASDGQSIVIDAGPYEFDVSKTNNHTISISGIIKEWDDGSPTLLNFPPVEYPYSWPNIDSTDKEFTQVVGDINSCGGRIYYQIKKVSK